MEQVFEHAPNATPAVVSDEERHWAAGAHLAALVMALLTTWMAGLAGVVGAGSVYLLKRDSSPFVAEHAREALNFNLSMFIYAVGAVALAIALIGATVLTLGIGLILTLPAGILLALAAAAIAMLWLACSIIATTKAWNGERYRYPFSIRLFR